MIDDFSKDNYASSSNGEIEIERIPTRTVEARSTDLKPAFDYLHMPRYQQPRCDFSFMNLILHAMLKTDFIIKV